MARMISSKNMGGVSELTLVANIRPELVEIRSTMTHGTRLRLLLRTLYGIRRAAMEETTGNRIPGPLESLEFLHFVRFALLENDTKFLLGVTFDGAWEPYIRAICEQAGPLLDVIFCHTEGYNAHASDKGFARFSEWVRAHQVEADFFFADSPSTTAKDVKLLKESMRRWTDADPSPEPVPPNRDDVRRGIKALHQLKGLDEYFPAKHENDFLRRTAQMILTPVLPGIGEALKQYKALGTGQQRVHRAAYDWVRPDHAGSVSWPPIPAPADSGVQVDDVQDVQGNILTPYPGMTHGATLLMRITNLEAAQGFLENLNVTVEGATLPRVTCNVGFTMQGLERMGVPQEQLEKLPHEFREGMAARAGWLGDLGVNHPSHWNLPLQNWPPSETPNELRVRMSSVDFVLQLQTSQPEPEEGDHLFGPAHPLYAHIEDHFGRCHLQGVQIMAVEVQRHVGVQATAEQPWGMEHFGYLDGVSQPIVNSLASGAPVQPVADRDRIALGEVVLGYADDRDGVAAEVPVDFLRNGSFQVIRKLKQDVGRFRDVLAENADIPELAERMMGRPLADADPLMSGAPDDYAGLLDYDFAAGECKAPSRAKEAPADSHIRRSNPRNGPDGRERIRNRKDRAVPRIARRGMSYGSDFIEGDASDCQQSTANRDEERGLLFSCFNTSLADQFEVVQRWLAGANSSDVVSMHNDPFMGLPEPGRPKTFTLFDEQGQPTRTIDLGETPLVTLEWGLYLFTPSLSAIRTLVEPDAYELEIADLGSEADVRAGEAVIGRMETLLDVERARDPDRAYFVMAMRWKVLIEDLSARETMRTVWAAIRARGGLLETPYGVLVGRREQIAHIFRSPDDFSVSGYWDRMRNSLGEHYLGMDPKPAPMASHANPVARNQQDRFLAVVDRDRYARESEFANAWISKIGEAEAFEHAFAIASRWIQQFIWAGAPVSIEPEDAPNKTVVNVRWLVDYTVSEMCSRWFNLPLSDFVVGRSIMASGVPAPAPAHNPDNFKSTARYIFSPNPTEFVRKDGQEKGSELLDRATAFVARTLALEEERRPNTFFAPGSLLAELFEKRKALIQSGIEEASFAQFCAGILLGTIHGFVGPVGGSATSLLNEWIKNRELWRQQLAIRGAAPDPQQPLDWESAADLMLRDVEEGMRIQPFPYVLHRTPVRDVTLRTRPRDISDRATPVEVDFAIEAGSRVVLGMVSGAHDSTAPFEGEDMPVSDLLFGGRYPRTCDPYGEDSPEQKDGLHACPGKAIGMGTILGIVTALSQAGNLRRLAPLKLELDPFSHRRMRVEPGSDPLARGKAGED